MFRKKNEIHGKPQQNFYYFLKFPKYKKNNIDVLIIVEQQWTRHGSWIMALSNRQQDAQ